MWDQLKPGTMLLPCDKALTAHSVVKTLNARNLSGCYSRKGFHWKAILWELPCWSVAKTLCSHCKVSGFDPGQSQTPHAATKDPVPQQKSKVLYATTETWRKSIVYPKEEKVEGKGEGGSRRGRMDALSLTQWTWIWSKNKGNSGWQSWHDAVHGVAKVSHDWATELNCVMKCAASGEFLEEIPGADLITQKHWAMIHLQKSILLLCLETLLTLHPSPHRDANRCDLRPYALMRLIILITSYKTWHFFLLASISVWMIQRVVSHSEVISLTRVVKPEGCQLSHPFHPCIYQHKMTNSIFHMNDYISFHRVE